ncbi:MAG TPA: SseB family protein [Microbacterium sp.]|nr:SseB family protein [Microbacterium sp.]
MALFSRRDKRGDARDAPPPPDQKRTAPDDAEAQEAAARVLDQAAQQVPSVGISVSSFGGLGTPGPTRPAVEPGAPQPVLRGPEFAPPQSETVKGLRDNALLRDALASLDENPEPVQLLRVARQVLQNHLFLRVKGDARSLLGEGKNLPLAVVRKDDQRWVMAYSSGVALQHAFQQDGDADTSAMGQPVLSVLSHVLAGEYTGIMIDPASSPARLVLPRDMIQRMVEQADPKLQLKTLLAGARTPQTVAEIAQAMTQAPMYVAVNKSQPDPSGSDRLGVAEARDADGNRILELYSHPLEVVAMGRSDQPLPFTAQQLGEALAGHEQLRGVVLDAAGPWIQLTRDDLAPVIALAA